MSPTLVALHRGEIAELRLANPPLNLVTQQLTRELRQVLRELAASEETRVVLLTGGGGKAFCAGSDIGEFTDLKGRAAEGKLLLEKLVYRQLARLPMPTIAVLEGDALGGGLELALCCDLRVAGAAARLGMPETRLGVLPGSGGTQRLPRIIGPAFAKELILMGGIVDADDAHRMGLVNRVVPEGQAHDEAVRMAEQIAERGPLAVRLAKQLIDGALDRDLDAGFADELDASEVVFESADIEEGAEAFRSRRQPRFQGR